MFPPHAAANAAANDKKTTQFRFAKNNINHTCRDLIAK